MTTLCPSTCMKIDPDASALDISGAIDARLSKARGVLSSMIAEDNYQLLGHEAIGNLLWCLDGLINEAAVLHERLGDVPPRPAKLVGSVG